MSDKWITLQQAAAALGVGETSIRRRIAGGKLESKKTDGRVYIRLETEDQQPEDESDLRQLVQVLKVQNAEQISLVLNGISKEKKIWKILKLQSSG